MATKNANRTKSDRFRDLFTDPAMTVSVAAEKIGIGYAFAYGIATRSDDPLNPGKSLAETRANRRKTRAVNVVSGVAVIAVGSGGFVRVDLVTGKVTRSKK